MTREPAAGSARLRDDWLDLEGRASPTVFLSWQWLGHWLHIYQPNAWVLRVKEGSRLIGLGLVVEIEERRHGVIKSHCLRLHQTGHKLLDQIWIEYNGFLAEHGKEEEVADACLQYLCNSMPDWDEFVIGAIDEEEAELRQSLGEERQEKMKAGSSSAHF